VINQSYLNTVKDVCEQIIDLKKNKKNIFFLISGPQGSGKSTFSFHVKKSLEKKKLKVLVLSIDNFYLSKNHRLNLSKKISNLFETRGVPGTHNFKFLKEVLKKFRLNKKARFKLPLFSKGHDDILKSKFIDLKFPYDVFILEGWCVGYQGSSNNKLQKPINKMEKDLDPKLNWRKYVNEMSKKYNISIYKKCDFSIFLKIPSFNQVFYWRKKQEQQIPKKLRMTSKQLKKFISFYQRITMNLLKDYKKNFNGYISIDEKHNFGKLKKLK
jgi:D-glycerate 3-kinase